VVAIAFFMQSLDGDPQHRPAGHGRDLAEDPLRMQGVIIAYMLTVALLIPASGWIADRFGTKKSSSARSCCSASARCCAPVDSLNVDRRPGHPGLGGALMLPVGRLVVLRPIRVRSWCGSWVYHHSRPARPVDRPDHGRLDGGVPDVALDLPDQPAGGLIGCYAVWKFIPTCAARAHPLR
jgi:hypothetical protein